MAPKETRARKHVPQPNVSEDSGEHTQRMQETVDMFLRGKNLRRVMNTFCNDSVGQVVDPITETLCMMLTTPLQLVVTEVGVTLFRDKNTHVFPYPQMTRAQIDYVKGVVRDAFGLNCAPRGGLQMGGGCVIKFDTTNPSMLLSPTEVFEAFFQSVFESKVYTDPGVRYNVCNIVLQRVLSCIYLSNEAQQDLFAILNRCRDASQSQERGSAAQVFMASLQKSAA